MIDGFSITGYRSFGPDEVKISDLSQINIFIGKYNCGKSNILRFAKRIAAGSSQQARARAQTRISIIAVATNEGRSSSAFRPGRAPSHRQPMAESKRSLATRRRPSLRDWGMVCGSVMVWERKVKRHRS